MPALVSPEGTTICIRYKFLLFLPQINTDERGLTLMKMYYECLPAVVLLALIIQLRLVQILFD